VAEKYTVSFGLLLVFIFMPRLPVMKMAENTFIAE
jgi:hypothetical protein